MARQLLFPPAAAAPPVFCGWHRSGPREPWTKLCRSASEGDCWRQLLDVVAELSERTGENVVLREGRLP